MKLSNSLSVSSSSTSSLGQSQFHFVGVVETGLFIGMASKAYFGNADGSVKVRSKPTLSTTC